MRYECLNTKDIPSLKKQLESLGFKVRATRQRLYPNLSNLTIDFGSFQGSLFKKIDAIKQAKQLMREIRLVVD